MMDIYCPKCAEPTDNDTLHEVVEEGDYPSYKEAAAAFRKNGCVAIGYNHNPDTMNDLRSSTAAAMYDLLGDDMDGVASMMDDFEYIGAFNE